MAAALCVRPADCLTGRRFFGARRGVRSAPAARGSMQQRDGDGQLPARASLPVPVPGRPRAARGERRRRSPAATGSPPHKRVMEMENVVLLKRGEQIPPEVTAALMVGQSGAETETERRPEPVPAAADQRGAEAAEAVAADQRGGEAERAAPAAAAGRRGAEEVVAAVESSGARAEVPEPVAAADQTGAQQEKAVNAEAAVAATVDPSIPKAKEEVDEPVAAAAAADQRGAQAKEPGAAPPAAYSGPSFVVAAPEPRALPMPALLLKRHTAAASGGGLLAAPTAAAA
ncbi:hypothetical protein ACP4OV_024019 [Aristida adscensionis]